MTKKIIKMPALGESVHEATINAWLVKAGDTVKKYDPLAEVISDKVTTEVPSEYSGVIDELLVDEDEEIPIGQAILSIIVEGVAQTTKPKIIQQKLVTKSQLKRQKRQPNQAKTSTILQLWSA